MRSKNRTNHKETKTVSIVSRKKLLDIPLRLKLKDLSTKMTISTLSRKKIEDTDEVIKKLLCMINLVNISPIN